ncbi:hypothetical protein N9L14_02215 [Alphaproteobacteria bacterium]|nr:hypothetical protein [Alphaproteobacteria bacterium]
MTDADRPDVKDNPSAPADRRVRVVVSLIVSMMLVGSRPTTR